ncbi:glycerophosphodiester phosphodiesterase GDPDL4-like [Ananas comosus]|uniref:glycerophosphodiester phosphodiesterase n=1 Tax=Ananas comosus TaxID=4615 RepID=A0A6P5GQL4_ANACO|nr:glycerophosphodiester phosphodiesterase GDPDL4-like [Ananas comosus]
MTLSGNAPAIIAKGGFSGLFPDSSGSAYSFALIASSPATTLWCDVRLTKDSIGICLPDLKLDNCTNIQSFYPEGSKDYVVNGVATSGWFPVDYNSTELSQVSLQQAIYTRTNLFDYSLFAIFRVEDIESQFKSPAIWLNVQHDMFYTQHNLSMRNYIIAISKRVVISYISSPEVSFLTSIAARVSSKTKLVFRFLDATIAEPSTNQTYGSLLKNLTFIKTFASGILVPKNYIWPVTSDNYLQPSTSVVTDAHKAGLEIYAADFANDNSFSYNYSYDPLAEYLNFIDNGIFSVDGVVSDFPITPSEAVGCFSSLNKSSLDHGKPVIISHYGASGDYPDCTDLAYQKAVDDGADVIDCPVQVTEDRIPICMSSINLMDDTTVSLSNFSSLSSVIRELQSGPGIFTFNLTWAEIKTLQPMISAPESIYHLQRNPRYKNAGNFMKLSDFLAFAKGKDLSGVLITVENAAFMAQKLGFSVTDAVIHTLSDAGYNNQTTLQVMIQSSNSSVLVKFKQQTKYNLVYLIDESINDATPSSLADIKKFADAVAIDKKSVFPENQKFITAQTNLVSHLQNAGLSVYAYVLRNEFVSQAWDFLSDPTVQINSYVQGAGVDGVITDFVATARRYKRNLCMNMGNNTPNYMGPVQPGGLFQLIAAPAQPPALPPMPILTDSDVVEPPLPNATLARAPSSQPAGAVRAATSIFMLIAAAICAALLLV